MDRLAVFVATVERNCLTTGYITGRGTDSSFYHAPGGSVAGVVSGAYGFASLSDSAYEYFRNMATGSSENICVFNRCYTSVNYDYAAGGALQIRSSGRWNYVNYTLTKRGHLALESTNLPELWIASDGTPEILPMIQVPCELGVVSNVSGVICKMVSYNLQQTANLTASLTFRAYVDSTALGLPAAATVRVR